MASAGIIPLHLNLGLTSIGKNVFDNHATFDEATKTSSEFFAHFHYWFKLKVNVKTPADSAAQLLHLDKQITL